MGKKTTGRKASGMFNTFWYKVWTESEYTCRDVGKYLGMSGASARSYFIGERIPTREVAEKLCKLFDVDVEKGVEEFNKGYAEYHKSLATTTEVIMPSSDVIPSGTTAHDINT